MGGGSQCTFPKLTWFLKLLVVTVPSFPDLEETLFHSMDITLGAVALWETKPALAPAVILSANQLPLWIAGNVAESSSHKAFPQVLWQQCLQAFTKKGTTSWVTIIRALITARLNYCCTWGCLWRGLGNLSQFRLQLLCHTHLHKNAPCWLWRSCTDGWFISKHNFQKLVFTLKCLNGSGLGIPTSSYTAPLSYNYLPLTTR